MIKKTTRTLSPSGSLEKQTTVYYLLFLPIYREEITFNYQ